MRTLALAYLVFLGSGCLGLGGVEAPTRDHAPPLLPEDTCEFLVEARANRSETQSEITLTQVRVHLPPEDVYYEIYVAGDNVTLSGNVAEAAQGDGRVRYFGSDASTLRTGDRFTVGGDAAGFSLYNETRHLLGGWIYCE